MPKSNKPYLIDCARMRRASDGEAQRAGIMQARENITREAFEAAVNLGTLLALEDITLILSTLLNYKFFRADAADHFRVARCIWNSLDDYDKDGVEDNLSEREIVLLENRNEEEDQPFLVADCEPKPRPRGILPKKEND